MTAVRGGGGAQVFLLAVLKTAMFWDLVGGDSFPTTDIFYPLGRKKDHEIKIVFQQLFSMLSSSELAFGIIFSHPQLSWFCFKQENNSTFSLAFMTCISMINICQFIFPWFSLQSPFW